MPGHVCSGHQHMLVSFSMQQRSGHGCSFETHNYPQSQSRASKSGSSSSTLASKGGREISGSLSQVQRTLSSLSLPGKDLGQCPKRTAKLALRALKLSA